MYRWSHYLHLTGHKYGARVLWHLNGLVTGADIPPPIEIGPGFLIPCPSGAAVAGKAGRNFTVMMCSGIGGELGRHEDIGAGSGLPLLGDDVFMEPRTGVLGPVRVGNRVRIKAGATVTTDVADDVVACAPPARFFTAAGSLRAVRS
jgi:serine O-acetyltransferase